ncbi:MAG: hypothetical protein ACP5N1_00095 [Candidatus Woesearchaeota archaeon]
MNIRPYNTNNRTEEYFTQLENWIQKIEKCDYEDFLKNEAWSRKIKLFPINIKDDILMIIEPKSFAYHSFGRRCNIYDNTLKNQNCEVQGLFNNSNGYYHGPPDGDYDLKIETIQEGTLYIDPHFVAYAGGPLPPYVFLPFPEKLKDFRKFLPYFAKNPKRLEKILDNYYKKLSKDSSL